VTRKRRKEKESDTLGIDAENRTQTTQHRLHNGDLRREKPNDGKKARGQSENQVTFYGPSAGQPKAGADEHPHRERALKIRRHRTV